MKVVVFTNGVFDIIHVGHIRLLRKAKELGDHLVVGINSDRSTREIKGIGHPIIPQEQRAEVLRALYCVDRVFIFDEPDPLALIKLLKPDILVKGADWAEEDIIGKEEVKMLVRIPLQLNISTSDIIRRIRA